MTDNAAERIAVLTADRDNAEERANAAELRLMAAVLAENEACAALVQGWLAVYADRRPEHVSAQTWACDAVTDLVDAIRARYPARRDASEPT